VMEAMQNVIHLANVLLLLSFLVSDILWLRLLNLAAGVAFIVYFTTSSPPVLAPVGWNVLFMAINVVQVYRILVERRPVRLKADELALYKLAFRVLTPREFERILAIGRWEEAGAGECLVEQGVRLDRVLVLHSGATSVVQGGARVAELGPGQLVGEMGFLTDAKTSARVVTNEPTRYFALPADALRALFKKHPELRIGMQMVIGNDLVAKLRAA
jgi:hypothetical protein